MYPPVWHITEQDVKTLRSPGGDRFAEFVNTLIRNQAFILGISDACINTTVQTNVADGGVDAKVEQGASADATGRMRSPTIWQYKAVDVKSISQSILKKEINKPYTKDCIQQGYAYRLCICDHIADPKKEGLQRVLRTRISEINSSAPDAQVLSADDLAAWANRFNSVVLSYFRPTLSGRALSHSTWQRNVRAVTQTFVPVPDWNVIRERIEQHVDLSRSTSHVVLPIQGAAGVGKTRLACETLAAIPNATGLVLYTDDETCALEIAYYLAEQQASAILVADECGVEAQARLRDTLAGSIERVRVVAIDNTGNRTLSGVGEVWIQQLDKNTISAILEENYSHLPVERRNAYASLAGGFIKLAAWLCDNDELVRDVDLPSTPPDIRQYFGRLPQSEQRVIEAIALVIRVGFRGEVSDELDALCRLAKRDRAETEEIAHRLHDGKGFVQRAGRYFYVSPDIISNLAFECAWRRLCSDSPDDFLAAMPPSLLKGFLDRVSRSANPDVREKVSFFFQQSTAALTPDDLRSVDAVARLEGLILTSPKTCLPLLRGLVEQATLEHLRVGDQSGTRRRLVWLAERLARFPEFFDDAERVLLRLALAETEPALGNNATRIWQQLFRVYLSGTSLPFVTRIDKLRAYLLSGDPDVSDLALEALKASFDQHGSRLVGPPIIAGRIPPEEWKPNNQQDQIACIDARSNLLTELLLSSRPHLVDAAQSIAISNIAMIAEVGHLKALRNAFEVTELPAEKLPLLLEGLQEFLHICESDGTRLPAERVDGVRAWLEDLKPHDPSGRLVALVGVDRWHHIDIGDEAAWKQDLRGLARELCLQPELIKQHSDWLCSDYAKSVDLLGFELGKEDVKGVLFDSILDLCLRHESTALARGYIAGLADADGDLANVNEQLDAIQRRKPQLAYEMATAGGDGTKALQRTLGLFDAELLSARHLAGFALGVRRRPLNGEEFQQVLIRLVGAVQSGDDEAAALATRFVAWRLNGENEPADATDVLDDEQVRDLIWRLLESAIGENAREAYRWQRVLEAMLPFDAQRAARVAARAVLETSFHREATSVLLRLIAQDPQMVMRQLGPLILDDRLGWKFQTPNRANLISQMPPSIVIDWIEQHGVEAARRLAPHLPRPLLNANDEPVVPPLTEFVLERFEDDDQVFDTFCVTTHSGQLYSAAPGTLPSEFDREAEVARRFLDHRLRRVREWAAYELEDRRQQAARWRQWDEEGAIK